MGETTTTTTTKPETTTTTTVDESAKKGGEAADEQAQPNQPETTTTTTVGESDTSAVDRDRQPNEDNKSGELAGSDKRPSKVLGEDEDSAEETADKARAEGLRNAQGDQDLKR